MGKIITVCYGQRQEWDSREEAELYFLEGMMNSDGSEPKRHTMIYLKVLSGENIYLHWHFLGILSIPRVSAGGVFSTSDKLTEFTLSFF